jgi:protein-disulfide isomerase
MISFRRVLAMTFALPLLAAAPLSAAYAQDTFSAAQKEELGKIIDAYIMDHPDVIMRAVEKDRANQAAKQAENAAKVAAGMKERIKNDDLIPVIGNKDGDVLIVEFFDYNCGYCKKALPTLQKLVKDDPKVAVAFVEFPILSPASNDAAAYALAASKQGKYWEYHQKLMELTEQKTVDVLKKVGTDLGLDVAKLEADAKSDAIKKELEDHKKLGQEAGINGTPAFFVNSSFTPGYLDDAAMKAAIERARANAQPAAGAAKPEDVKPQADAAPAAPGKSVVAR